MKLNLKLLLNYLIICHLVISLSGCGGGGTSTQSDYNYDGWLTFQGNNQRTGNVDSTFTPPFTPQCINYGMNMGNFETQPIVVGHKVYLKSFSILYIYNMDSKEWKSIVPDTSAAGVLATPAMGNKYLYFGGSGFADGQMVYALDPVTDNIVWKKRISYAENVSGNGPEHSLLFSNNQLYVATVSGVFALNGDTGAIEWQNTSVGDMYTVSAPAIDQNNLYIHNYLGKLFAFSLTNGSLQWSVDTNYNYYGILAGVSIGNGLLYVGAKAFSPIDGHLVWDATQSISVSLYYGYSSAAITQDTIYVCNDKSMYALDAQTGSIKWNGSEVTGPSPSAPLVIGDYVYITQWVNEFDGASLRAYNKQTGEICWEYKPTDCYQKMPTPAFVNNTLYYGTAKGLVIFRK